MRYLDRKSRRSAAFGRATGPTRQLEPERMVREYRSATAYHADATLLARDGWQVLGVDDRRPRSPLARLGAVLGSALRGRPAPCLTVTYKRLH